MRKQLIYIILFLLTGAMSAQLSAQTPEKKPVRILFVVDASRSMLQHWDRNSKLFAAKAVVNGIVDSIEHIADVQVAMRIYGHQSAQPLNDCYDSKLEIPFAPYNAAAIRKKLDEIRPQGVTPIAYSMEQAIGDFGNDYKSYRNILVLVSDGFESCGLNPCEVILRMRNMGIITKSYVIGIGIDATEYSEFSCMGETMNIQDEESVQPVIDEAIARIFNSVFTRVNLLDVNKDPTETDVLMTFYDHTTGKEAFNYYHTINPRGLPDTLTLDPNLQYDMQVHTVPEVWKKDIHLDEGKLNIISEPAAQGFLRITVRGETFKGMINCIVLHNKEIVATPISNNAQKLLVGDYDIEILTLPVIRISGIKVEQNKTTTVEVSAPGYVSFNKNEPLTGAIYEYKNNQLVEIFELNDSNLKETLAIQPGKYKVIYRYNGHRDMDETHEVDFEVVTGVSQSIRL
ncbi:MAG: VWA domain-containing protein [Chitinophagales bacterium]